MKLLYILLFSLHAFGINIGFNQAWFHNNYSTQYLDKKFDRAEIERVFSLASSAGSKTIRLWFFEGKKMPMINWNGETPVSLKREYIDNVITMLKIANDNNIKVYMTLFDAHSYTGDKKLKEKFKSLFTERGQNNFIKFILTPLLKEIKSNNLLEVFSKIDLINEGDTLINRGVFDRRWKSLGEMICRYKKATLNIPITVSIRWHSLLPRPLNFLSLKGPMKCADFLDLHSYNNLGKVYACKRVKRASRKKKIILGEFGQSYFNHRYSDKLQLRNTVSYAKELKKCGFSEALAWRLSDIRPGYNKESRYSFESFGQLRPTFYYIKDFNSRSQ